MALALPTHRVNAQQQRFRATPIVKNDFTPTLAADGTIGLNQKGQIVYAYVPSGGGTKRAWIWLPEDDASYVSPFGDAGFHELGTTGISTPSIARDINESGDVVGQGNGVGEVNNSYGVVWRLGSSATPSTIGNFGGSSPWSNAHAISDHSPPKVTGDAKAYRNCTCVGSLPDRPVARPFYVELGTSTLTELETGAETYGWARDIVKVSGQNQFYIAGYSACAFSNGMSCEFTNSQCDVGIEAKFWYNSVTPSTLQKLSDNDAEARGVNVWGSSVGYSFNTGLGCKRRAAFWATSGSAPVDLGAIMPSGQGNDGSRAEAVNNLSNPKVVGWNDTTERALLWEHQGGSNWSVLALNSQAAIGPSYANFTLRQAHDINDDGWIVCWGFCDFSGTANDGTYVVLLAPYAPSQTCEEDINGDGVVNVQDMLAVINNWGLCVGDPCGLEDINTDAVVDVIDLLAVINAWGACDNPDDGAPQTVEDCESDCANQFPGYGAEYTDCVGKCIQMLCETGALPPEDCPD